MSHLHVVEALAINADDGTLCDESTWVDVVNKLEDHTALAFLGQHKQDFLFVAGIEALAVDDGTAAVAL